MDRSRAERLATHLAVRLVVAAVAVATVAMADGFLDWDLLSGGIEKVAELTIAALALSATAAIALSLVLNVSRLASSVALLVGRDDER